jgi:hypothetical protein
MELGYVRTGRQFDAHRRDLPGISVVPFKPLSNFIRSQVDDRIIGAVVIGRPPKCFYADGALPYGFQVPCQSAFHDEAKKVLALLAGGERTARNH